FPSAIYPPARNRAANCVQPFRRRALLRRRFAEMLFAAEFWRLLVSTAPWDRDWTLICLSCIQAPLLRPARFCRLQPSRRGDRRVFGSLHRGSLARGSGSL